MAQPNPLQPLNKYEIATMRIIGYCAVRQHDCVVGARSGGLEKNIIMFSNSYILFICQPYARLCVGLEDRIDGIGYGKKRRAEDKIQWLREH